MLMVYADFFSPISCSGDVPNLTPDDFEKNMRETLEEVRKYIPKVFVNLVLLGNISEVRSRLKRQI